MLVVISVYLQNNISIMYLLVVAHDKISPKSCTFNVLTNNISLYKMHQKCCFVIRKIAKPSEKHLPASQYAQKHFI